MSLSKINKYNKLNECYIYCKKLKNKIIITNKDLILSKFTFRFILNKYFDLYEKDQLDNFPNSYYVYVSNNLNPWDIKHKYNLELCKTKHKIESIYDVYKLLYHVIIS